MCSATQTQFRRLGCVRALRVQAKDTVGFERVCAEDTNELASTVAHIEMTEPTNDLTHNVICNSVIFEI